MRYHHLFTDGHGESHRRTVDVDHSEQTFAPPAKAIEISEPEPAKATLFLWLPAGWDEPIHPTPKRQFYVCIRGGPGHRKRWRSPRH